MFWFPRFYWCGRSIETRKVIFRQLNYISQFPRVREANWSFQRVAERQIPACAGMKVCLNASKTAFALHAHERLCQSRPEGAEAGGRFGGDEADAVFDRVNHRLVFNLFIKVCDVAAAVLACMVRIRAA
jgi:hypothetical protein